jgi:hypothetical protein
MLWAFYPGKELPAHHRIGSWVGPRTGMNGMKKRKFLTLAVLEVRPLVRPSRTQSLYRLR